MGKIKEIIYERLSDETYSEYKAGLNYYYQNAIGINEDIDNEFLSYEEEQIRMRNSVLKNAMNEGSRHPFVRSTLFEIKI